MLVIDDNRRATTAEIICFLRGWEHNNNAAAIGVEGRKDKVRGNLSFVGIMWRNYWWH